MKKNKKRLQSNKSKLDKNCDSHDVGVSRVTDQNEESLIGKQVSDAETTISLKRDLEDDSDIEDQPKQKKKKKKLKTEALNTDNKGKKSIRQMKREKHAQRQMATEALAKDTLKQQNIQYLLQWKHNKSHWKFMKARQIWLFKNKFSVNLISDDIWPTLLNYFQSAQGNVKNMLLKDANEVIRAMDTWAEMQNSEVNEHPEESTEQNIKKPDDISYKRARDIIQNIEE
ncbi:Uncharacterized protein C7orf50 homolog [Eumeta japonica]|uniref:Uncharacterized protein C7orf50 homolog n=1 Tax=Eumeta variegata TaxID=151549 RepID=A0A4C1WWU5_EUMVA|nr:Uncharacterized protein C7orf50 homolog [Eumeta japonica]